MKYPVNTLSLVMTVSVAACAAAENNVEPQSRELVSPLAQEPAKETSPQLSPLVRLSIAPGDLMTNTGRTPPAVRIAADAVGNEDRERLRNAVQLVRWPSRQLVPSTKWKFENSRDVLGMDWSQMELQLPPGLEDGWYAIEADVGALAGFRFEGGGIETKEGTRAVRFHTSSKPIVRKLLVTDDDSGYVLQVMLSERVLSKGESTEVVSIRNGDQRLECESLSKDALSDEFGSDVLSFRCTHLDLEQEVLVAIDPELRTIDGAPVTGLRDNEPAEVGFVPSKFFDIQAGEYAWTPPAS